MKILLSLLLNMLLLFSSPSSFENTCNNLDEDHNLIHRLSGSTNKAKRDTLFVSKYNAKADYNDLPDAYNALPLIGGTIILDNIHLGDVPYTGKIILSKPNVSLVGTTSPKIDLSADSVMNATPRIEGKIAVKASGFMAKNIVFQSIIVDDDALVLSTPIPYTLDSKGKPNYSQGAKIYNCAFIGKTRYSLFHCLLIENYTSVEIVNITTLRNVWGVALKSSNLALRGLKAKNHDYGPVIAKADNGKTVENIRIEEVDYFSTSTAAGGYKGNVMAQNYSPTSHLRNVVFKNITIKNGGFQVSTPNNSPLDGIEDLTIENLTVDNSQNPTLSCIYLTGSQCNGKITIANSHLKGGDHSIYDANNSFQNIHVINLTADKAVRAAIFNK